MSADISAARRAVRAALTAVTATLVTVEREQWKRELDLLRECEASLTERLNARAIRPEVRP